jgi:hypothetical protein
VIRPCISWCMCLQVGAEAGAVSFACARLQRHVHRVHLGPGAVAAHGGPTPLQSNVLVAASVCVRHTNDNSQGTLRLADNFFVVAHPISVSLLCIASRMGLAAFQVASIGWSSVFYIFGSLGVLWFAFWAQNASSSPVNDSLVSESESAYIIENTCDQVRIVVVDSCRNRGCCMSPSLRRQAATWLAIVLCSGNR